jgi:Svf1-like N-terminal lipocalin domain
VSQAQRNPSTVQKPSSPSSPEQRTRTQCRNSRPRTTNGLFLRMLMLRRLRFISQRKQAMLSCVKSSIRKSSCSSVSGLIRSALNIFAQFTCRVWHPSEKDHKAWSSTNLETFAIDEKTKRDFTSDKVKLTLSEDLSTYTFTVSVNPKTIIDVPLMRIKLTTGSIQARWSGFENWRFVFVLWRGS